ncbi:MAG: lipopolysaccharide biosynthesis protein [Acidobacteriaceae bacterium]|nr:lipopolysaccharide biosynthesis protein [Acidobacteriaceae bacterium]
MAKGLISENIAVEELTRSAVSHEQSGEISFTELFSTLSRRRKTVIWAVGVAAFAATGIAFLIPAQYTAEAVILTPQQAQPSLSAMAQLAGAGAGLSGLSLISGFGLRNPSDLYVGILQSRTIADALINRFNLKQVYNVKFVQQARKHLARRTAIKAGKDTLIHIEVDDRDPKRAAQLANAYVEELSGRNTTVALTEASQRRMFFEGQLAKEKGLLTTAEIALRDTEQITGLVVPSGQAEALIRSASQLNAEILSREAQLAGMRTYAADENPRFQTVKRELAALRSELANLESGEHVAGTPEVSAGKLPQAGLEYLRKYRDVKYHESLYETLAKQYEAARLDEAKAAPLIQVIDRAVVPERKSWPPRLLIVLISSALAAFGTGLLIVVTSKAALQAA